MRSPGQIAAWLVLTALVLTAVTRIQSCMSGKPTAPTTTVITTPTRVPAASRPTGTAPIPTISATPSGTPPAPPIQTVPVTIPIVPVPDPQLVKEVEELRRKNAELAAKVEILKPLPKPKKTLEEARQEMLAAADQLDQKQKEAMAASEYRETTGDKANAMFGIQLSRLWSKDFRAKFTTLSSIAEGGDPTDAEQQEINAAKTDLARIRKLVAEAQAQGSHFSDAEIKRRYGLFFAAMSRLEKALERFEQRRLAVQ